MVQHHDIFWLFEIVMLSLSVFPFFDGDYVSPFCCDSGIRECKWLWCVTLCVCLCLHFLFFLLMEHGGNYRVQWWIRAVEYCVCCPLCYCCILGGDSLFTRLFCRRVYLMQREEGKSKCGQNKKRWSALRGFTNGLKTGKSNDIAFVCNISVLLFGVLISIFPRNPPTTFLPIYFVSHSSSSLSLSLCVCFANSDGPRRVQRVRVVSVLWILLCWDVSTQSTSDQEPVVILIVWSCE